MWYLNSLSRLFHHLQLAFVCLALIYAQSTLAVTEVASTTPAPDKDSILKQAALTEIDEIEILKIPDPLKKMLDEQIRPIKGKPRRAERLHDFLFKPIGLNIQYDSRFTRSAEATYQTGSGNCISHAALFIASARYLNMHARFQKIEVPRTWEKYDDFFVVPGHINAVINLPFKKITAEFINTYYYVDEKRHKPEILSDKEALAEFYNNLGMEALQEKEYARSIAYLNKALELTQHNDAVWSNLGVVYKLINANNLAEQAYVNAVDIDQSNISAVKNLYIFYHETAQAEKAEQFSKRVQRYNKKNPYFLARLAETDILLGNYESALNHINKAIKIQPQIEEFYVSLAKIHYKLGQFEKSAAALTKAAEYSKNSSNNYQKKLEFLEALYSHS